MRTTLLLLLLFGLKLEWLPVVGYVSFAENPSAALLYMVMPVMTLFLHEMGVLIRMARASTLEVLRLDYITHARAKGLSESAVLWRHAFKNAFGPTWTLIGLVLGNLLGGIAVTDVRLVRRGDPPDRPFLVVPSAVVYHDKEQLNRGRRLPSFDVPACS